MGYANQLEHAIDKALKMEPFKTDSYRPPRFRLSSSPFCAYRFLYSWYDFVKSGYADFWDYSADFYTGVGTAIHSILQKWIPLNNPGLYLGNWQCPICGKLITNAVGPKFCKKCQKWMRYEEYEYTEGYFMSGHWDGMFILDTSLVKTLGITIDNTKPMDKYIRTCKNPVKAVILEYKSAGSYKAKKITDPTPENKAQAMMYAPCATRKMKQEGLNVEVIGSVVKYISRDNPNTSSNDFFLPYNDDRLYKHNKAIVKGVVKAVKEKDAESIRELGLPCKSRFKDLYSKCAYMESCQELRKHLKSFLKDTVKDIKKDFLHLKEARRK